MISLENLKRMKRRIHNLTVTVRGYVKYINGKRVQVKGYTKKAK